ncbi:MAG TPA: hypothetical protein VMF04_05585 [Thermoplasmata archaeon]|nr:hypothetical protein [Thermoplasmata archaeon]
MSSTRDEWTGSAVEENAGWIAGAVVIAAIFAIGAAFWFMYHPM